MITHQPTLALSISSTFAYYHTRDNHLNKISGIRTRAILITLIFKIHFGWKRDIQFSLISTNFLAIVKNHSILIKEDIQFYYFSSILRGGHGKNFWSFSALTRVCGRTRYGRPKN